MDVRAPFLADMFRRLFDDPGAQLELTRRVDSAGEERLNLVVAARLELSDDEYVHLASAVPDLHPKVQSA